MLAAVGSRIAKGLARCAALLRMQRANARVVRTLGMAPGARAVRLLFMLRASLALRPAAVRSRRLDARRAAPTSTVARTAVAMALRKRGRRDCHCCCSGQEDELGHDRELLRANNWREEFLLPTRQSDLFRWCLQKGLKVMKPLTLMSMGEYREPAGAFYPSVGY